MRQADESGVRLEPNPLSAPAITMGGSQPGLILGTAAYMSPEQARGQSVDKRTDIWAFGCVLFEMLSGRAAFGGETISDTIAAILQLEPDWSALASIPAALTRLLQRCLEKDPRRRLRDIGDARLELDFVSRGTHEEKSDTSRLRKSATIWWPAVTALALITAVASWVSRGRGEIPFENPLATANFTRLTADFPGAERDAAISPDGKFVAFRSDRDGPFDVWLGPIGARGFENLTQGTEDDLRLPDRSQGFSADGSEVWLSGGVDRRLRLVPLMGRGEPRLFLGEKVGTVAWSPDGTRLVYHTLDGGDPIFVADRTGANERRLLVDKPDTHNHYLVWSLDGKWIYFVKGVQATYDWDLWRIAAAGGEPERLTEHRSEVGYPAPIDAHTVLYVARDHDGSGPWLWALDVDRKQTRRVSFGLQRYTSLAASADGRRLVASEANPTANLWRVPILNRVAEERDVAPFQMPTVRALMPRFGGPSLFYLSSRGEGDGLWRYQDGQSFEVWKGSEGALLAPAAISPDGQWAAIAVKQEGRLRLHVVSADGAVVRAVAPSIDVRGTASWSPDGKSIVTQGIESKSPALFEIPVDGGNPRRLVEGPALNPVWSPQGDIILYSGPNVAALAPLRAVRPDGTPIDLPHIQLRVEGERYRFLPNGKQVVYMQGLLPSQDFWLLDFATKKQRPLTRLSGGAAMRTFDVTPDGKRIVFDRLRENSDIVLIDLAK
jgi:Tol biopolymer transport system component